MTPHEINIAIGKSLGFAQCPTAMCQGFPPELCYRKDTYIGELPDFYGSLDRMHEVERSLDDNKYETYEDMLDILVRRTEVNRLTSAPANLRAEAYLRTLNLWTNTNAPSLQDATVSSQPLSM